MAPLQNWEHGASAFDLGDDAVICVVGPSSAVVAAGHGCGMDGIEPSGRRSFWLGSEVDDDFLEPSWHRSMHHDTVIGDGVIGHGILAGTYLAEYRDSLK